MFIYLYTVRFPSILFFTIGQVQKYINVKHFVQFPIYICVKTVQISKMLDKNCRLCFKTLVSNEKFTENWTEIVKMVQILFKIDVRVELSFINVGKLKLLSF